MKSCGFTSEYFSAQLDLLTSFYLSYTYLQAPRTAVGSGYVLLHFSTVSLHPDYLPL